MTGFRYTMTNAGKNKKPNRLSRYARKHNSYRGATAGEMIAALFLDDWYLGEIAKAMGVYSEVVEWTQEQHEYVLAQVKTLKRGLESQWNKK